MFFNPDRGKPTHEVIFFPKTKNIICPNLYFNNLPIVKTKSQKHLKLNLDVRLMFTDLINERIGKVMKVIGLHVDFQYFLPVYKSFIRSYLD